MKHIEMDVNAGIDLLDKIYPGWDDWVDLDELDMNTVDKCILGQVFGHYDEGVSYIIRFAKIDINLGHTACELGFDPIYTDGCYIDEWLLRMEWIARISERRKKA